MAKQNLLGQRFGRLLVVDGHERYVYPSGNSEAMWLCECDCGARKAVRCLSLRSGFTRSCGCLRDEQLSKRQKKHGLSKHPLFTVWYGMYSRCHVDKCTGYKNYGSRGIKVCKEWKDDVKTFMEWALANGWNKDLQIDRINNDGNYEPSNCRFVTRSVNILNSRLLRGSNTTGYVGISKQDSGWSVAIGFEGERKYLGYYSNKIDAAVVRDSYAVSNKTGHKLNFPQNNGVQYYEL